MQSLAVPPRYPRRTLQLPTKPSRSGRSASKNSDRTRTRKPSSLVPSPRTKGGFVCTCSKHPDSNKCSLHGYPVPRQKLKTLSGNKEVIRRALSPSNRRFSLRWWNFRPTPSRLSVMSTA